MGLPREVDPHTALLEELHRTAGAVQWLNAVVADLEQDRVTAGGPATAYVALWQAERKHLAVVARTCVDVGIEERRVRLAESAGQQLASVIRAVGSAVGPVTVLVLMLVWVGARGSRGCGDGWSRSAAGSICVAVTRPTRR